ncbi:MFS transporter [Arcticibacterium luteifluviistationis]|uniref:MFS transporter n=1 Tax=Arcticibacterium luteifluviistationis TaxID=1784714 RepID=A0A2Z4G6P5_9BACT|nr:MFS transporter [Arcticibacterium luteifluviistationis]AWV96743.1 MFS transporter [Arcticibacterium luteifluviistationis]
MVKTTKVRYGILAAIFVNVVINYMDRSNISVAASLISEELNLDTIKMGFLFSAFGFAYSFSQIPGGFLADRLKIRGFYALSILLWSVATVIQGFVTGFIVLLVLRVLIGIFESPSYPMNNKIVTKWFPANERASSIAIYTSGQFIGLAFLTPVLTAIQFYFGWRALFFITGGIGILWGMIWYLFYRDPKDSKRISEAELKLIEDGGGIDDSPNADGASKFNWNHLKVVLTNRKLWGIYLGQFGLGATIIFFLTWFPKYLVDYKGMDFLQSGYMASIPFIFAFFGVLISGFISDLLVKKGSSPTFARKLPIIVGLLLSTTIVGANYVNDPFWVTFFMSIAFFGNGLASIAWVLVSLLAPKELLGLTGGVFNFIGGLSGMVVPAAIGYLVQGGDFAPAIMFVSVLALMGAASYIFLVGKVERVELG